MTIVRLSLPTHKIDAAISTYTTPRKQSIPSAALLGIGIASIIPALFWMGMIWAAGRLLGFEISGMMLLSTGTAIALFLGLICSALLAAD
jgi:hypothetical protein